MHEIGNKLSIINLYTTGKVMKVVYMTFFKRIRNTFPPPPQFVYLCKVHSLVHR